MLDVAHPSAGYLKLPLLRGIGNIWRQDPTRDHPLSLVVCLSSGKGVCRSSSWRAAPGLEQEWFFRYMLKDEGAIDARDRRGLRCRL